MSLVKHGGEIYASEREETIARRFLMLHTMQPKGSDGLENIMQIENLFKSENSCLLIHAEEVSRGRYVRDFCHEICLPRSPGKTSQQGK